VFEELLFGYRRKELLFGYRRRKPNFFYSVMRALVVNVVAFFWIRFIILLLHFAG
jgi:hypothetical protein